MSDLDMNTIAIRYLDNSIIDRVRHRTSAHYSYSLHATASNTLSVFHIARISEIRKRMSEENKQAKTHKYTNIQKTRLLP